MKRRVRESKKKVQYVVVSRMEWGKGQVGSESGGHGEGTQERISIEKGWRMDRGAP
jgi:hypothetical protein